MIFLVIRDIMATMFLIGTKEMNHLALEQSMRVRLWLPIYFLLASSCAFVGWHPTTPIDSGPSAWRSEESPSNAYVLLPAPASCPRICNSPGNTCRSICSKTGMLAYDLEMVNGQFRDILLKQSQLVEMPSNSDALGEGPTVQVSILLKPWETSSLVWAMVIPGVSLTTLPYYNDTAEYLVQYDVLHHGEKIYRYSYMIRQRCLVWFFGLLAAPWWELEGIAWTWEPFSQPINKYGNLARWIRIASGKIGQTANLFLEDARRDGVLVR